MKMRIFQAAPPEFDFPIQEATLIAAQSAGASATYEVPIFTVPTSAKQGVKLAGVRLTPSAAISPGAVASTSATAFINWYRGNVRIAFDGSIGVVGFTKVATGVAYKPLDLWSIQGAPWTGYLSGAVTGASSTGATLVATGNNSLSNGILEVTATLNGGTLSLIVDPGTAAQETVVVSAYATSGVFTIAASGTFANSHVAGCPVVLAGPNQAWQGTSTAATANTTTGGTVTATSPSLLTTIIGATSTLIFEPGTSNQETVPIQSLNTGTGVYVVASSYNGGKFALAHANGCAVCVAGIPRRLIAGDVLTFKWAQSATTGLALPATLCEVNYKVGGTTI